MMDRPSLDQLSDVEFEEALEKFRKTEEQAAKEETTNRGDGWDTTGERLQKAREDFEQELRRRSGCR
jgi:hypothetical protein